MPGLIAIVGRPNVGKSALFNRIARRRIAIVHDQPGVTRDRISAEVEWNGKAFTMVDTGGIGLLQREKSGDVIARAALEQVGLAIESASVIILVVNVQEGTVPLDVEVSQRLRASGKPVLVAVNKVDHYGFEAGAAEFSRLGFQELFPVTAIHGRGIEDLMERAIQFLPARAPALETRVSSDASESSEGCLQASSEPSIDPVQAGPLKLAIVGRPNVGKSSIINALTHSDRVVVSPIPGTTRDAVDVPFEVTTDGLPEAYVLIDTAGMRKTRRVDDSIEFFSVKRAEESILRCDICILVLDAESGITEQDKKVADRIVEARKACIVVVNKWDLMNEAIRDAREEEIDRRNRKLAKKGPRVMTTLSEFGQWVQQNLFFLDYAPVVFTSAKTSFHLDRLLEAVRYVAAQLRRRIPTSLLNRALQDAIERRQPVTTHGHRLKLYYATQVKLAPPTFRVFVNRKDLFTKTYEKYLGDQLRAAFGYEGCPVVIFPRDRPKTIEPVRKLRPAKKKAPKRRSRR